jgi:hypothetical protein
MFPCIERGRYCDVMPQRMLYGLLGFGTGWLLKKFPIGVALFLCHLVLFITAHSLIALKYI